jgi:DNA repair exonuclease SbcCD ATPase subunit
MNLQYVKLKNFKSYPDAETEFDLSFDGIKLVVGENGDGKTTFIDAIIWGIYGKNQDDADGIVNRKTKKNCKVEVGFKVGSNQYSIVRYRKHDTNGNKLLFFKGAKNISQRTTGATQELIDEVIEIQYNTMISSVILSSELYKSFLRSSRADRLKTFESILSMRDFT